LAAQRTYQNGTNGLVLKGVSLTARSGRLLGIIGPNGSGKSTLLKVIGGVLTPLSGQVLYDGQDIFRLRPRETAKLVAAVSASEQPVFPFTVEQTVLMGRSPYAPLFGDSPADLAIARECMQRTRVCHLARRKVTGLSSGELQRVLIARALAQRPKVLLLDEPTAHLDVNFQQEVMELATDLAHEAGLTVIAVLHDLNLAGKYCDDLVILVDGQVAAAGPPNDVLTEENLLAVYGVRAIVGRRPDVDRPAIFVVSGASRDATGGQIPEGYDGIGEGSDCDAQ
jgi:iron complex transport system ATP-binding protein